MPAPRKYPNELRERSVRLVVEAMAEDSTLSLNGAVLRIGSAGLTFDRHRQRAVMAAKSAWCPVKDP